MRVGSLKMAIFASFARYIFRTFTFKGTTISIIITTFVHKVHSTYILQDSTDKTHNKPASSSKLN